MDFKRCVFICQESPDLTSGGRVSALFEDERRVMQFVFCEVRRQKYEA